MFSVLKAGPYTSRYVTTHRGSGSRENIVYYSSSHQNMSPPHGAKPNAVCSHRVAEGPWGTIFDVLNDRKDVKAPLKGTPGFPRRDATAPEFPRYQGGLQPCLNWWFVRLHPSCSGCLALFIGSESNVHSFSSWPVTSFSQCNDCCKK